MSGKKDTLKVCLCFCNIQTDLMQITFGDRIFIIIQAPKNKKIRAKESMRKTIIKMKITYEK